MAFKIGTKDISNVMLGDKQVVRIMRGNDEVWSLSKPTSPEHAVRFISDEARTITPKFTNSGVTLQYSVNEGATWTNATSGAATPSVTEIWFRGKATGTKGLFTSSVTTNAWAFSGLSTNKLKVQGNIQYLLCDELGDKVAPDYVANYAYTYMFYGCTSLTTAPQLPATTLADRCYQYMFYGCTSLTTAPALPATTLATYCYYYMFRGCTSLTTAPALPATTLVSNCYHSMFYGCTSLTTAPQLPATTLADRCYRQMFYGCSALTQLRLAYTGNDNPSNAFTNWVQNISTSGTLYKKGTLFESSGNNTYPSTWTQVAWT